MSIGVFFNIEPADWGRAPGIQPLTESTAMLYAEFEDHDLDKSLIDALQPIDSESEAWLCAEAWLVDRTPLWPDWDKKSIRFPQVAMNYGSLIS